MNNVGIDYPALMDDAQQLCALLDAQIEDHPDDEELKELLEFLAARCAVLLYLQDA